jgi:hypothetical protein
MVVRRRPRNSELVTVQSETTAKSRRGLAGRRKMTEMDMKRTAIYAMLGGGMLLTQGLSCLGIPVEGAPLYAGTGDVLTTIQNFIGQLGLTG